MKAKKKNLRFVRDEKYRAHLAVKVAVRRGDLVRPSECELCGRTGKTEAHHPSYEPEHHLDVIFLCSACHREVHPGGSPKGQPSTGEEVAGTTSSLPPLPPDREGVVDDKGSLPSWLGTPRC